MPTSDIAKVNVVGVAEAAALYHDVDDAIADDDASYVRGLAGVQTASHTVGYATASAGPVTQVVVNFRASRGTGQGSARMRIYDGTTLIGTGPERQLGAWTSYRETFAGLSVASASQLRTQITFTNTAGVGALRYSAVSLELSGSSTSDVDASTIDRKLLFGYQGWHAAPGDGSQPDRWIHWFTNNVPDAAHLHIDLWPDTRELGADEKFATSMTMPGGGPAVLYSGAIEKTVMRHFAWMKDNDIDGVMLQRFTAELGDPKFLAWRDQVTGNVRAGAEASGRVFCVMYDISGQNPATLVQTLESDWLHLVQGLHVTDSARYLHEAGKPVVALWGLGFADRPGTPAQASQLIAWFKQHQVTLVGGVPSSWRTLDGDSSSDPAWAAVYRSFDVISPWSVGRYHDDAGADAFKTAKLVPDVAAAAAVGRKYMPVIFPGFSWHNLQHGAAALNQIPRRGGRFWWHQLYNAMSAGSTTVYGAMFDEVDEGTAMYKLAPTHADVPAQGTYLTLDVDGEALPSDWYLQVAGAGTKMLRKTIPLTPTLPIAP